MKKKWLSAAAAAVLSVCALVAPISVPNTVTPVAVQAASSGTTLADMPSAYQSAAEWILQNRIISEGSVKDWATIYDQIVAGNGTLKYVVKWQSKQTITLEQRKQLQTVLETAVNDWTDWLVGYENWPYTHVNVQIVGWAVLDQNCLLDLQPDETVYTTTIPADTSYITDGNMAVSELPTLEPIGDETRYRYIHWADQSYQYPDGYENRYDMYLQATQGMIDMGGFGYHWGQQLSDNAVLGLIAGTSSMHILEHEMGHSFGLTDFYGGEGESDGFPPGGFPDGGTSIMTGRFLLKRSLTLTVGFSGISGHIWRKRTVDSILRHHLQPQLPQLQKLLQKQQKPQQLRLQQRFQKHSRLMKPYRSQTPFLK